MKTHPPGRPPCLLEIEWDMAHITGTDRAQVLLLPDTVDDYVGPDNPVRFIDAFVDSLDLAGAGFERTEPKETGRPPDPHFRPFDAVSAGYGSEPAQRFMAISLWSSAKSSTCCSYSDLVRGGHLRAGCTICNNPSPSGFSRG